MNKSLAQEMNIDTFFGKRSSTLSNEIAKLIPGGVDSPFRSFSEVGGHTIFFEKALGSKLFDVDGNEFIDYLGAWGPAILGHCVPAVVQACQSAVANGPVFGCSHEYEIKLAKLVISAVPSMEMVRFVNSGTEAVMSAVRLARGYTGKDLIVMFEGCYHGHSDSVLASNLHSSSSGIPESIKHNTILVPYNDIESLESCLKQYKGQIAACLIEPVAGSMSVIAPKPGYLEELAALCKKYSILLIFDEVLTGFRISYGGAQKYFDVKPDITCFGKALAGGMAIGAYGASVEIMSCLQPLGAVYQAGTFSGNPVTMAGGIATLELLANAEIYKNLEQRSQQLFEGLAELIKAKNLSVQLQRVGSMFAIVFAANAITNFKESLSIDQNKFAQFFHYLLKAGIYLPPSSVDAAAISAAHSEEDIEKTIKICSESLLKVFS